MMEYDAALLHRSTDSRLKSMSSKAGDLLYGSSGSGS